MKEYRITVGLTDKQEKKVKTLVKDGLFKSKSQVLSTALEMMLKLMERNNFAVDSKKQE